MPRQPTPTMGGFNFPKPRGVVLWMLVAIFAIWVMLALAINYGGADTALMLPFVGSTKLVLHGQLWRLVTATLIHEPSGDSAVSHITTTLMVLYFFGPALEDRWGKKKMVLFLFGTAAFGFVTQTLVGALLPTLDQAAWYGGLGMVDALVIAWALQARPDSRVLLFFVLPVPPMAIVAITIAMNVLKVIAKGAHFEGLISPFGAMLAGYAVADGSPIRRLWLQLRLKRLQAETAALRTRPAARVRPAGAPPLRVIEGGQKDPPKDKRFLN